MDTIKDKLRLEALYESGRAPWDVASPDRLSAVSA
jgi:hypothetical protein